MSKLKNREKIFQLLGWSPALQEKYKKLLVVS